MTIQTLASWLVVAFAAIWFIAFLIMIYYRFQEERLYKNWETEAKKVKSQSIAMPFIEGQIKNLDRKFQPQLDKLNRQKQFLRDVLPLMRK